MSVFFFRRFSGEETLSGTGEPFSAQFSVTRTSATVAMGATAPAASRAMPGW